MPSYDNKVLTGDQLVYYSGLVKTALAAKQDSLVFNTAYNASSNKVATMSDIPDVSGKQDTLVFNTAYNASTNKVATMSDLSGKQDALVFNTAYNASTNKVATMADIPSRILASEVYLRTEDDMGESQDGYNYTPIDYYINDLYDLVGSVGGLDWSSTETGVVDEDATAAAALDPEWMGDDVYYTFAGLYSKIEGEIQAKQDANAYIEPGQIVTSWDQNNPTTPETFLGDDLSAINTAISGKQDALVFNTAYNASSNKVATMSDITTALGGISSFSFEIVQSLPQSNISTSKIYLVAKQTSGTNQVYTEYAYVNNAWEIIGDTSMTIDTLSNSEVATIWATATATT